MLILRKLSVNTLSARFCSNEAYKEITKIGFIGLGNMGYRMCKNLINKGFDVTVYDKKKESIKNLEKVGALAASDAENLVSDVDCIITMVPAGPDLLSLYTPSVIECIKPCSLVIDSSTIEYTVSQELEKKFKCHDIPFIDAPVSGGILAAESGTLTFMVGGGKEIISRASPVLKAMGTKLHHCGPVGSGQIAKACNNLILGITMAGTCEAMAIGINLGLDPQVLTDVINSSSGQSWSSSTYNPIPGILPKAPSSHGYKAGFAAQMILKDLAIANKIAINAGLDLKIAKETFDMYDSMCKSGLKDKDFSVIYEYVQSRKK